MWYKVTSQLYTLTVLLLHSMNMNRGFTWFHNDPMMRDLETNHDVRSQPWWLGWSATLWLSHIFHHLGNSRRKVVNFLSFMNFRFHHNHHILTYLAIFGRRPTRYPRWVFEKPNGFLWVGTRCNPCPCNLWSRPGNAAIGEEVPT